MTATETVTNAIKQTTEIVELKVFIDGNSSNKREDNIKKFTQSYTAVEFPNWESVLAALQNPPETNNPYLSDREKFQTNLLSALNQGLDSKSRSIVRFELVKASEGPEKAFQKQVDSFMAHRAAIGKPVTREVAVEKVKLINEME